MNNFNFQNPVTILFGKGKVAEMSAHIPANAKILLTYGGGSIFNNGAYNQVKEALKNFEVVEFGGIEPNPHYETCMKAVELVKRENITFLLAVGGGSVLDGTKFIAAAAHFNGSDPWDILSKGAKVQSAMPLASVLTLAATGSEMNGNSVITRQSTTEKLAFGSLLVMPKFSVLDPTFTFSLPKRQVVNGIVDAFAHVFEQYMTYPVNSPVQDRMAESLFITLIEEGKKTLNSAEPDYDTRANLMWAATMALNGIIGVGVKSCWATHQIGHELTALHGLDHAVTLAIVMPGVMQIKRKQRHEKILQFADQVWGLKNGSADQRIDEAIQLTDNFFRELGVPTYLSEHQINQSTITKIVERFKNRGLKSVGEQADISLDEVELILKNRL